MIGYLDSASSAMVGYLYCAGCGEPIPIDAWPMHQCRPRFTSSPDSGPSSAVAVGATPSVPLSAPSRAPRDDTHGAGSGGASRRGRASARPGLITRGCRGQHPVPPPPSETPTRTNPPTP